MVKSKRRIAARKKLREIGCTAAKSVEKKIFKKSGNDELSTEYNRRIRNTIQWMRVAKPPPAGEGESEAAGSKRKKRKRKKEGESADKKKRKRVAESENVEGNNATDVALWTDDDWRKFHRPAGDEHTQWVIAEMPKAIKPLTGTMIKCIQCKKNAVKFYLVQARSADEPMSRLFDCTACGKHWRRSN
jgi:DNA-directed RNA polymerase subunit M/transcription elongation factor TFIIS